MALSECILKISAARKKTIEAFLTDFAQANDLDVTRSSANKGAPFWILYDPFQDDACPRVVVVSFEKEKEAALFFMPGRIQAGKWVCQKGSEGIFLKDIDLPEWLDPNGTKFGFNSGIRSLLCEEVQKPVFVTMRERLETAWSRAMAANAKPGISLQSVTNRLERVRNYAEQFRDLNAFQSHEKINQTPSGPN
ncbi:MAG: hypothetical protein H6862_01955 [Rhodospirillales bacterium]|nr:hypothetical protein [Rhodospirillales bacterium]